MRNNKSSREVLKDLLGFDLPSPNWFLLSENMTKWLLWSSTALYHKVLFKMDFQAHSIDWLPCSPIPQVIFKGLLSHHVSYWYPYLDIYSCLGMVWLCAWHRSLQQSHRTCVWLDVFEESGAEAGRGIIRDLRIIVLCSHSITDAVREIHGYPLVSAILCASLSVRRLLDFYLVEPGI